MVAKVIPLTRHKPEEPRAQAPAGVGLQAVHGEAASEVPSLDSLLTQYASYVHSIALRILGSESDAEDVAQDTFLAAYRGMHTLRDPSGVKAWLGKIAVNIAARRLRRRRLRSMLGIEHNYFQTEVTHGSAEQHALLQQVFAVLDAMPARVRVPWSLRHLQGEQLETVAELCDCSLSSVKRRISRAQSALERALGERL